jgi:hypothetical protein
MDAERRGRHQPSIEARFGDDAFAVEKAGRSTARRHGLIECCCHRRPLQFCSFLVELMTSKCRIVRMTAIVSAEKPHEC